MENYKEKLLKNLITHIERVRGVIQEKLVETEIIANKTTKDMKRLSVHPEDFLVQMNQKENAERRIIELTHLDGSPYFIQCQITDEKGREKVYYFSKHQFAEEGIFSWVSPMAAIRFENPGTASYMLPDGVSKTVLIKQKEQYMIVDGKVLFFSVEKNGTPRELIYQEHFTQQKSEFALPEIVAQMEKAQDQVIRAHHKGPLVISGPAGSGKTTLALHRVAYLTQAPDTYTLYPAVLIIVFVQDTGTKEYFSTLLPGLGINNVEITTFGEWALRILGLSDYIYTERYGSTDEERDIYEYQKLRALREGSYGRYSADPYTLLQSQYKSYLSANTSTLFIRQKEEKKLDRFDVTVLLKAHIEKYKKFETKREYQTFVKDTLVKKTEKKQILYSLMIVDEFQNYLPEQLTIFKNCLNVDTSASIYVGDMAQQVRLGTIKRWEEIGEVMSIERVIKLSKVYRNTKNILSYIQSLGYQTDIPVGVKDGPAVAEVIIATAHEEIDYIQKYIGGYEKGTIGVISKNEAHLIAHKEVFKNHKNIHVLSMAESQGVEFDIVFIVGVNASSFTIQHALDITPEHVAERTRMQKDLLYVALTRAITELHIIGTESLKEIKLF